MKKLILILAFMPFFASAQNATNTGNKNSQLFASSDKYSVTSAWHIDKLKKAKAKRAEVVKDSLPINSYKSEKVRPSDKVRITINPVSHFDDETVKWNGKKWAKDSMTTLLIREMFKFGQIACDHKSWEATTHEETENLKEYISFECGKCRMIWLTDKAGAMYISDIKKQLFKKKKQ